MFQMKKRVNTLMTKDKRKIKKETTKVIRGMAKKHGMLGALPSSFAPELGEKDSAKEKEDIPLKIGVIDDPLEIEKQNEEENESKKLDIVLPEQAKGEKDKDEGERNEEEK